MLRRRNQNLLSNIENYLTEKKTSRITIHNES